MLRCDENLPWVGTVPKYARSTVEEGSVDVDVAAAVDDDDEDDELVDDAGECC